MILQRKGSDEVKALQIDIDIIMGSGLFHQSFESMQDQVWCVIAGNKLSPFPAPAARSLP